MGWGRGHQIAEGWNRPVKQDWTSSQACDEKEFNKAVLEIVRFSLKLSVCQAVQHTLISLQGESKVGRLLCGPVLHHTHANKEMRWPTPVHSKLSVCDSVTHQRMMSATVRMRTS